MMDQVALERSSEDALLTMKRTRLIQAMAAHASTRLFCKEKKSVSIILTAGLH